MGKKKGRLKKDLKAHDDHHRAIHDTLVRLVTHEDGPEQRHVIPSAQPWHHPSPQCWCSPKCVHTHPYNGGTVWAHSHIIH